MAAVDAQQAPAMSLRISNDCQKNEVVDFYLANSSSKELDVLSKSLPWAINSPSIRYTGYLVEDGKISKLSYEHILADYFTERKIPAKLTVTGSLNLNSVFTDLSNARSTGDVVVYWEFDANRVISPLSTWRTTESGIILFPKDGFLSTPCGGVIYEPFGAN